MASLAKPREQISGIVGGKIVPATDTPLLTSASTPWFGFLLEKHNAGDRQDICGDGIGRMSVSSPKAR